MIPKWERFPTSVEPQETLRALLDAGVTTIRLIPIYSESAGSYAAKVNRGEWPGPTIVPTSSVFEQRPGRTFIGFGDAETAREWVRREALLGSRWIKVYDNMDVESLRAMVETAREYGMQVFGYSSQVPPHEAAAIGMRSIEHNTGIPWSCLVEGIEIPEFESRFDEIAWYWGHVDDAKGRALMQTFREQGTAWVPTLVVSERIIVLGGHDGKAFADPETAEGLREALRTSAQLAVQLHRLGGLVGIGTDFPIDGVMPGESVHRELQILVEHGGASPLEALQMATLSSASILGFDMILGSVEPGMLAHLVVLEGNPLEDITNVSSIALVVHDGRVHIPAAVAPKTASQRE